MILMQILGEGWNGKPLQGHEGSKWKNCAWITARNYPSDKLIAEKSADTFCLF